MAAKNSPYSINLKSAPRAYIYNNIVALKMAFWSRKYRKGS
jgi:hypothetical protein